MLFPALGQILQIVGLVISVIGFWIDGSYLILYPCLFRVRSDRDFMGDALSLSLTSKERLLDVGCGTGRVSIQFAKRLSEGEVIGIDVYEGISGNSPDQAIRNAKLEGVSGRVKFQHGNALELPFPDNSFDLLSMGSILHELHSEEAKLQALREAIRVLQPGGHLVIFELLRSPRMFVIMLFFGFVWKTKVYWLQLFSDAGLETI